MGQQTSFLEFSQEISKLHLLDCKGLSPNDDAPIWKILFLSPMTDDEICSFFNFDDIRTFRRYHPDRLALVLFKCIQQLVGFCERGSEVSDYCSIMNALRMLGNALPYCFEDLSMKGTKLKESTITSKRTQELRGEGVKQPSPFAENFAHHFFWENRTCEGSDLSHIVTVHQQWATGTYKAMYDTPLGEILVNCLTKLCFIPRFTVGPLQTPSSTLAASQSVELSAIGEKGGSQSVKVFGELLWYGSTASIGNVVFRQVDPRRIQVLRVIVQCLSWNVFAGDSKLTNPFLEVLVDDLRCPLAPTLCQTLINRVSTHYSRGSIPYSSYLAADNAEKLLEQSLSILAISFEHPNRAVNCFLRVFDVLDQTPQTKLAGENFIIGLHRIIENPLYSSRTYLKDSQKVVHCTTEAVILLFQALSFEKLKSIYVANATQMIIPLLYIIQEAARDDLKAREAELAMYVLLRLSSDQNFLQKVVNLPVEVQPPLFVLPDLVKAVSTPKPVFGDIVLLMMCFVVSPASPRWFLAMFPAAATVCCNVIASISSLTEGTCFEINHALEFLVNKNVLKKGPAAQEACQLWVDGVVSVIERRLSICVPLYACLGVGSAGIGLRRRIDGLDDAAVAENEPTEPASPIEKSGGDRENSKPRGKTNKAIRFIDGFEAGMPLDELIRISEEAKVKLNDNSITVGSSEVRSALYETIASTATSGLRIAAISDVPLIRQIVMSDELRRWISGSLWRSIHMHNTRPPIYDFRTVKLY
ncbi:Hypothetical protein, putative [Bodo saltans]|uniref:Uncharacterized protein n=1 Tax=Bodo saltans TaxID=75058 RepID=A0A0S4IU90_BODSA|nr:Hypothetical protein, putative [Bodo saltans]|eukprot:CUF96032.1 Hypothetical protein, putative [Bodo saltans]